MKWKEILLKYIPFVRPFLVYRKIKCQYMLPTLGFKDKSSEIGFPILITYPKNVFLFEKTRINPGAKIITYRGKFIVRKFSEIAYGFTVITGNHTPTVGFPQTTIGHSHLNDKEKDVIVEEDVWIGANVTLLSGAHIGRGCVIGACSLVNKEIPPYAVVVGSPAKIIASKFTLEQILIHEEKLYPASERLSKNYLEKLFRNNYSEIKSLGMD